MKNNKLLKTLATLSVGAVAAVGCLGFAACGDDHKHTWGNDYGKDANGHWQICTEDNETSAVSAHVYDGDADTTCNTCGYVRTISGTNPGGTTDPGTNPGGQVTAHTNTYSFSAVPKNAADKGTLSQADFTGANAFLKVGDGVTYRYSKSGDPSTDPLCIEVKGGGLQVTFTGTGKITISFGSTGGSNTSGLAILKSDGTYVDGTASNGAVKVAADDANGNKAGLITMSNGTKPATAGTAEYTITEAGTYTIWCSYSYVEGGENKSRGGRIYTIVMVDNY